MSPLVIEALTFTFKRIEQKMALASKSCVNVLTIEFI